MNFDKSFKHKPLTQGGLSCKLLPPTWHHKIMKMTVILVGVSVISKHLLDAQPGAAHAVGIPSLWPCNCERSLLFSQFTDEEMETPEMFSNLPKTT